MRYVVVIGNLVRVFGFDTRAEAERFRARFDIMSDTYDPGPWARYSVSDVIPVSRP